MTRTTLLASAAALALLTAADSKAETLVPVFEYAFPASFDGTGTLIEDLSPANQDATPGAATLSSNVPPGAPAGSMSLNTADGGARTVNTSLLTNAAIDAALGFRYDVEFFWDGSSNSFDILKLVDYTGTEALQILVDPSSGDGTLAMFFDDAATALELPVSPNEWVTASLVFTNSGPLDGGALPGEATLTANGASVSASVIKTAQGDGLGRPFGIGGFPIAPNIIQFQGDIFSASVSLIVPEPGAAAMVFVTGLLGFGRRR